MSRSINISYRTTSDGAEIDIELRTPYHLLGTQQTSMRFWSLPIWHELGVTQLAELGHSDPIYFIGWDAMDQLANEIRQFQDHITEIEFSSDVKASWLAHLVYCYNLLTLTAPRDSIPELTIG